MRHMPLRLPTNDYAEDVHEREILLAVYEELTSLRRTLQYLAVLATPLALVGLVRLLVA